jgi:hypothetical protein
MTPVMTVDELCALVEARARSLGHRLEPWQDPGEEVTASRSTKCVICGRAAYVRIERGLLGAAGPAYSEVCSTST